MGRKSGLLGWIGAVLLLFALLSLILQIFSDFVFAPFDLPWIWGNALVGAILLGVALVSNLEALRERMRSGEARRAGRYGTSAILSTALILAVLAMLAFLSTRYHARWDWTETGTHSLSDQTRKVLEGLEERVAITGLYSAVAAPPARQLLARYEYASDMLDVEFVDPQARPGVVKQLGVGEAQLSAGLLHVAIGSESVEVAELTEESLTNALVALTRREQKKVYFTEGHGERPMAGEGAEEGAGMSFAADALANENYVVEKLFLPSLGSVPEDADVVVISGPTRPFHELEKAALDEYLIRGGALMVLIDPRSNTDLYPDLDRWGVAVGDDVIVDRVQGLFGRPTSPFAAEYAPHPITEALREATLFHMARSVQPTPAAGSAFTILVRTSEESWGETNLERFDNEGVAELDPEDLAGPVPVAVAGTVDLVTGSAEAEGAEPAASRLVVVGDSDFASNTLIHQFRNRDLFVNAVNWLLGDVEAISVRPDPARASRLQLTREQFSQIRYLSLFVLPEAIAVIGVIAWWNRRRAPGR